MSCTVDERKAARRVADALRACDGVVAVDVLAPTKSQFDDWTIDAVVRADGIPPEVLRELALEGLTLRPMPQRAEYSSVVATV